MAKGERDDGTDIASVVMQRCLIRFASLLMPLAGKTALKIMTALEELPSTDIGRPLAPKLRLISLGKRDLDGGHDFAGYEFLGIERLFHLVVESIGPDRIAAALHSQARHNSHF